MIVQVKATDANEADVVLNQWLDLIAEDFPRYPNVEWNDVDYNLSMVTE
jgi:hypothetical protein